ncbi:hypothetical protein [Burkholderia territorii]|uniref:hypothetical protein n=1 Tax=Burkholderia territorii TaxID=1503055 RepID=UPI0012D92A52|nr:hypothetical protein [Burkholderia territorii]
MQRAEPMRRRVRRTVFARCRDAIAPVPSPAAAAAAAASRDAATYSLVPDGSALHSIWEEKRAFPLERKWKFFISRAAEYDQTLE